MIQIFFSFSSWKSFFSPICWPETFIASRVPRAFVRFSFKILSENRNNGPFLTQMHRTRKYTEKLIYDEQGG